jgi:hypothetical protein
MTAWRVRLNRIWNLVIISPAFLEALSMALRRADCSHNQPYSDDFVTSLVSILKLAYTALIIQKNIRLFQ